ncbi:MAG: hypothetical protein AAGD04_05985 [Pseudomonadota bacterium]
MLLAVAIAAFGYLFISTGFGVFEADLANIGLRTLYLAAACLMMTDVIQCADMERRGSRDVKDPNFWIYAVYMGYLWALLMILMYWQGAENAQSLLIQWGIAGAAFGVAMAFVNTREDTIFSKRFDQTKPITRHTMGGLYYAWPVVVIALIVGLIAYPPTNGWGDRYLLFQLVLLGSLMPLYEYNKDGYWWNIAPRSLGFVLLLISLFAYE